MDIAKYIGETTEYDKKQEVERRKVKSWLKSVSAFANGGGSPDKPGGLSIQLCKSEKKEFYIRYSS